jgi:hypothetical protein
VEKPMENVENIVEKSGESDTDQVEKKPENKFENREDGEVESAKT